VVAQVPVALLGIAASTWAEGGMGQSAGCAAT
jgi:hypothetical protein